MKRLLVLEHSTSEGPGTLTQWAKQKGYELHRHPVYETTAFPSLETFDALVVLGGSMGAYDEKGFPWLVDEKRFLKTAITAKKPILGICLGSQLLAEVNGGKVSPGPHQEIGWFQVELSESTRRDPIFRDFPPRFSAFHWHGDTFTLPAGAVPLASSDVYSNQGFRLGDKQLALQFHPEVNEDLLLKWMEESRGEMPKGPFVQRPEEILHQADRLERLEELFYRLLDRFFS